MLPLTAVFGGGRFVSFEPKPEMCYWHGQRTQSFRPGNLSHGLGGRVDAGTRERIRAESLSYMTEQVLQIQ